ncbi:MAG TPA: AAA family ATPase [Pyrinomonadaceae bacterium]|nr:AAA family ATPase [Pyrinomonadaceae bacterium]
MRINRLTLTGFRCFGPQPTSVELESLTALIGSNGSGKTAVLQALSRLFGISQSERRLTRSDFHVPPVKDGGEPDHLLLSIEAHISFPELLNEGGGGEATTSVPEFFQHLVVREGEETPYCRLRLDGAWTRTNLADGEIEEKIYWIKSADETIEEEDKQSLKTYERGRIHVLYVPAARDPSHQLKYIAGTLLSRLLNAIRWSDDARGVVARTSEQISEIFREEAGLKLVHDMIGRNWTALHDADVFSEPRLRPLTSQLEEIFKQMEMVFGPNEYGAEQSISYLSDGLKSLFYFALVSSIFDVEREAIRLSLGAGHGTESNSEAAGVAAGGEPAVTGGGEAPAAAVVEAPPPIELERLSPPSLTVFAIEEPENHLAPHYLARITSLLGRIADSPAAQVVLASHSASVLGRVDPARVRHFRYDPASRSSVVNPVTLPAVEDAAHKYIKEAVRAYPELYFSRLVVLCEGDSEEAVLPRVAECLDISLDPSMVSVVPLGGRHVNHFWRLLSNLKIPFVTLLDLDRERDGAGWGRIKYVCEQLLEVGVDPADVLADRRVPPVTRELSRADLGGMGAWDVADTASMQAYVEWLESKDVFFSAPLDLDLAMLEAFETQYTALAPAGGGPRTDVNDAVENVLGKAGTRGTTYSEKQRELFPWYSYLFLNKGKPSTHILALSNITGEELKASAPAVLQQLVARIKGKVQRKAMSEEGAARDVTANPAE